MAERLTSERALPGLREWRERHGLRLEEVSDLLGLSPSYLSRIERGERRLRIFDQVRIARVLGCRVGQLFPRPRVLR